MHCPVCQSCWLHTHGHWHPTATDAESWVRDVRCGDCGRVYQVKITFSAQGLPDAAISKHVREQGQSK